VNVELQCTSCGRKFEHLAGDAPRFCAHCGKPLAAVPPEVVLPPVVAVPPVVTLPPVIAEKPPAAPPPLAPMEIAAPEKSPAPAPNSPAATPAPHEDILELQPAADSPAPAPLSTPAADELDLAPLAPAAPPAPVETPADGIPLEATRCPNCGQTIAAGSEICVDCGYSRRLGRTLTTRVGNPEIPRHKSPAADPAPAAKEPEVEAERLYAQQKKRRRAARGSGDNMRLFTSILLTLMLAGLVIATPLGVLKNTPFGLLPGRMTELAEPGQYPHAALLLALFLLVVVPITSLGIRVGAFIASVETANYLTFLRVAGTLSVVLVTAEVIYISDHFVFKLPHPWGLVAIASEAAIALLIFTWYLQAVRLYGAIALWLFTVVFLAIAVFAAAAAYPFLARLLGIEHPLLPGIGEWFRGISLP
jgi:hypothetical protein